MDSINSIQTASTPPPRAAAPQGPSRSAMPAHAIDTAAPLSPRAVSDPVAGVVVMEYLSSTGEVSDRFPSSTVLAYLRSGLSADGTPSRDPGEAVKTEA
ncbi:MAG: hypothetical protein FWF24_01250 [Alphaproteobacteria bacterium]|nr:hypothetical protein [Alphaproteobacteria bacterium]